MGEKRCMTLKEALQNFCESYLARNKEKQGYKSPENVPLKKANNDLKERLDLLLQGTFEEPVTTSDHLWSNSNWYDTPFFDWDTKDRFFDNLKMAPVILISHSGTKIALVFGYTANNIKFGIEPAENATAKEKDAAKAEIKKLYEKHSERINATFWKYFEGPFSQKLKENGWSKGVISREKVTLPDEKEKDEFKWSFCTSSFFHKIYSITDLPDDETLKKDFNFMNNLWKEMAPSVETFRKKWNAAYNHITDIYSHKFRIWKISLGPDWFSAEKLQVFLDKNKVSMGPETGPVGKEDQVGPFLSNDRSWDVVYVCNGNQKISRLALFAPEISFTDTEDLIDKEPWIARHIITIADAKQNNGLNDNDEKKRWYPGFRSTFIEVRERDWTSFEEKILLPFFNMSLEDLFEQHFEIMKNYTGEISMTHFGLQEEIQELVEEKLQVILTGAPGTGKTYLAQEVAAKMILGTFIDSADRIEEILKQAGKISQYQFVQFHPGYDYSDFVEGIKPRVDKNCSSAEFSLEDGIFKKFCLKAAEAYDNAVAKTAAPKFVMVIDEINRADLSRVFGELFFGLEKDYRGKEIRTQYDYLKREPGNDEFKEGFSRFVIPPNLYIIGTMNDIDRSVESMDFALRRRFGWREISWEESTTIIDTKIPAAKNFEINTATKKIMAAVNNVIIKDTMELEPAFALGGAYFKDAAERSWDELWRHSIRIILNEYLRGNRCDKNIGDIERIWKQEVNKVVSGTYDLSSNNA